MTKVIEQSQETPDLSVRISNATATWTFVLWALSFIVGWMSINVILYHYTHWAFDKPPFILLNLMLSMVAAIQAPIIMMSGRQSEARTNRIQLEIHAAQMESLKILRDEHKATHEKVSDIHAIHVGGAIDGEEDRHL